MLETANAPMGNDWLRQSEEDKLYERQRGEKRDADWMRDGSIRHALELQKNNGGTASAEQIVAAAAIFLTYLEGGKQ